MLPPDYFIPHAEKHGLIQELGKQILEMACRQNKQWQDKGYPKIRVSINVSAKQFHGENFQEIVCNIITKTNLPYQYVELELTETIVHQNIYKTMTILENFKEKKIFLSIDDFGKKYSSLNYLKKLPVDALKLDRIFTQGLPKDMKNCILSTFLINLSHHMNLEIVAEGVETKEQSQFLQQQGCDEVQGYYYSKPMQKQEIENLFTIQHKSSYRKGF